ncbi:5'-3' exoribonuclease 4-like isoform X1 [Zingiber officinale]|uniref:5'-3' exoribonuclease 4-like isoform X1 n=2 Tax=Zingiber officinale TaxID=94328 RepID=UPI001C4B7DEA|nr:5'-3' exoribonuclease 4-like isoform X1 [Zingiber officinale]
MGIPAFYRWLVDRYPLSVVQVCEETAKMVNGVRIPVDTTRPNPNGVEFDNLYLDMNGIVHPCFHPEDRPAPKSYDEVYKAIFAYIDHIFSMIRPRKLLYMAVDGVAPRAKMNQQRARRFRAAKDAADAEAEAEKLKDEFESHLEKFCHQQTSKMDSNVITPGTLFMDCLSSALRYYICLRLNKDPGWRSVKVILSDASVPGEGEHKIAAYIRSQRNLPGFDPNTRHCLYGLDADLIMLALATHEIHFSILREDVRVAKFDQRNSKSVYKKKCSNKGEEGKESNHDIGYEDSRKKFQFLNIWILRDYLQHELKVFGANMKIDLERLIDDFVFICLFVGNDFLPHVPSLEISEGAIDLLMMVYKKEFAAMGGYLTNSFEVNLERVEHFLQVVGSHESAIFRKRVQLQKERNSHSKGPNSMAIEPQVECAWMESFERSSNSFGRNISDRISCATAEHFQVGQGEEDWKEKYYSEKFEVNSKDECQRVKQNTVKHYVEGICWVMHYYYQGVCSWQWFYPHHYAPFASDFVGLKNLEIQFKIGVPFKPFDQLMGVLPAASAHALPSSYKDLMINPSSSIIDFYPADFELDLNGKRFSWQAVCKLPFVDESRLLAEIKRVEDTLTEEEKQRNSWTMDALFVHFSHPLASKILSFYQRKKDNPKLGKAKLKKRIDPEISNGMNGLIYISDKTMFSFEIYSPVEGMEAITQNKTISTYFKAPSIQTHIARLPDGITLPNKSISKKHIPPVPGLWHETLISKRQAHLNRPIPHAIEGHLLLKLAHKLVTNYYDEKMKQDSVRLDKKAFDDKCNKKPKELTTTTAGESDDNTISILGKRKCRSQEHNQNTNKRRRHHKTKGTNRRKRRRN